MSWMNKKELEHLLQDVADGALAPQAAALRLQSAPYVNLGYATLDTHRGIRQGVSEVVYGEGKTPEQICGIVRALRSAGQECVLVTRLSSEKESAVRAGLCEEDAAAYSYNKDARAALIGAPPKPDGNGTVVVACAGTSDIPVAEEAALTAEVLGSRVVRLTDVGVAGIHRLFAHTDAIMTASAIVAVAGMEGALASVIGGMASCPVIAVPTSVGYGASFGGVTALLAMLNSCASGVSVVNIDNGFGAGYQAALIDHARVAEAPEEHLPE